MDLEDLKTFVDVMRRGSFAAVAREQGVAPSSVSRAISGLEESLGARLFQRTTRRLEATEAAQLYVQRVAPLLDELDEAGQQVADAGEGVRGLLRVSAPTTLAELHLVPLLPLLAERYPELSFELVLTNTMVDLVAERIDVALRMGRLADTSFVARKLADLERLVVASPTYLERKGEPRTPQELARGHDCLLYRYPGFGPEWSFRRPGPEGDAEVQRVAVSSRFVMDSGTALRDCARAGLGLALLPRWLLNQPLERGELRTVLDGYEATASDFDGAIWLVYPSRRHVPSKVRAFVEVLMERFARCALRREACAAG